MTTGFAKVKGAARFAGISERTMRTWIKQGLKHYRLPSGTILIAYGDVDDFINKFAVTEYQADQVVNAVLNELGGA